jgi:hypothetical protein
VARHAAAAIDVLAAVLRRRLDVRGAQDLAGGDHRGLRLCEIWRLPSQEDFNGRVEQTSHLNY